jgi:SAM-dependent methyltransferase
VQFVHPANVLLYIAACVDSYRSVTGPPEAVILPVITAAIAELLNGVEPDDAPVRRVLDVGCGEQPLRARLVERGYAYVSCDHRQNRARSVDFVTAIDGPLPKGLLDLAPFSLLVCTEVLEHVFDWDTAFRNLAQLSAGGGYVLITCPFVYFPHEQPYDFWRPTVHAVRAMAQRHRFTLVRAVHGGSPWDVLRLILRSQLVVNRERTAVSRLAAFAVRQVCRVTQAVYDSRWIQARVALSSEFYLNTGVLLQRDR